MLYIYIYIDCIYIMRIYIYTYIYIYVIGRYRYMCFIHVHSVHVYVVFMSLQIGTPHSEERKIHPAALRTLAEECLGQRRKVGISVVTVGRPVFETAKIES
jgi:hypothetical protein